MGPQVIGEMVYKTIIYFLSLMAVLAAMTLLYYFLEWALT
jgi:hypothetical protein